PVINGLTDDYHPCQALADLLTIYEEFGTLKGKKLTYVGDGNNVAHSLIIACVKTGVDISVATPEGYEPNAEVIAKAQEVAKETGATVEVTTDAQKAAQGAHAIYTDVWTS